MNFHSDEWIMNGVFEHYNEALTYFSESNIVCLMLAGSQNYGLDTAKSDIDTKLILAPSFRSVAMNHQPISTTHVRADNSHTDWKDVRLMFNTFRKQNLNFLECLFTPYGIINPLYKDEWNRLIEHREEIAHYNLPQAIKSMKGIAYNKYEQMEKDTPSHANDIKKFGYSPKELHHLLRVEDYIERYIKGESYESCLHAKLSEYLKDVKTGCHSLETARFIAAGAIENIDEMCEEFLKTCSTEVNAEVDTLLDDVQYNIMKIAIKKEIGD